MLFFMIIDTNKSGFNESLSFSFCVVVIRIWSLRASREQRSPDFMEMSELRAVLPSKKRETQNNNLTVSSTVQYPLATLTCKIREKNERRKIVGHVSQLVYVWEIIMHTHTHSTNSYYLYTRDRCVCVCLL